MRQERCVLRAVLRLAIGVGLVVHEARGGIARDRLLVSSRLNDCAAATFIDMALVSRLELIIGVSSAYRGCRSRQPAASESSCLLQQQSV